MSRNTLILAALAALVLAGTYLLLSDRGAPETEPAAGTGPGIVTVEMPALAGEAAIGKTAFTARCATCHGARADGIEGKGPPLIHKIYEPSHHGDIAFVLAARQGVRAHHWRFGDMPPVEGVTEAEIASIVTFIRTVQRANGIE